MLKKNELQIICIHFPITCNDWIEVFVAAQHISDVPTVRAGVQGTIRSFGHHERTNYNHNQPQLGLQRKRWWVSASLQCLQFSQGTIVYYLTKTQPINYSCCGAKHVLLNPNHSSNIALIWWWYLSKQNACFEIYRVGFQLLYEQDSSKFIQKL